MILAYTTEIQPGRTPPTEFRIFPYGKVETTKGTFYFDEDDCDHLLAERATHSAKVMVDYDHKSLMTEIGGVGGGAAAAWCSLEKRPDGLYAVNVKWTPYAYNLLKDAEYRYFSPAFDIDKKTKHIRELANVAITNLPAMKNIQPLVAASTKEPPMHKFGAMLSKYMKEQSCSAANLAEMSGMDAERVNKLMAGDAPTTEEMASLAKHMKFSEADLKECSAENSKDIDKTDGAPGDDDNAEADKAVETKDEGYLDEEEDDDSDTVDDDDDEDEKPTQTSQKKARKTARRSTSVDLVTLTGTRNPKKQAGILAAWKESAMQFAKLSQKVEAMVRKQDTERRTALIDQAKKDDKLTPNLLKVCAKMDTEQLEAFLEAMPPVHGRTLDVPEPTPDTIALSAVERKTFKEMGLDLREMAKFVADEQSGANEAAILASYNLP